ncbi:hypothetical protein [Saccharopolyspora sp. CA-218241]|uniref:hypothetical protein n=1 Tax=Saccharopolyspora sp. CA-218241 TaxID=3240027 RepID=UPI003D95947D
MRSTIERWTARGVAGALAVGTTLALAPLGAAHAAVPHQFTLCSEGGYASWAEFPDRHMATTVVQAGDCVTLSVRGTAPEPVLIRQGNGALIGPVTYDGRAGLNVTTVPGPSFYVH